MPVHIRGPSAPRDRDSRCGGATAPRKIGMNSGYDLGALPDADKPLLVQSHIALRKPVGIRIGADEKEQMTYRATRFLVARAVAPAHRFEIAVTTFQRRYFGLRQHLDIRLRFDALDKVIGH